MRSAAVLAADPLTTSRSVWDRFLELRASPSLAVPQCYLGIDGSDHGAARRGPQAPRSNRVHIDTTRHRSTRWTDSTPRARPMPPLKRGRRYRAVRRVG